MIGRFRRNIKIYHPHLFLSYTINFILQLTLPQHSVSEWSSLSENRRRCLRLQSGKTYGENLNLTEIYESFLECQKNYSVYLDSMENVVRTLGLLENVKNDSQLLGIIKEIRFTVEDIFKILEVDNNNNSNNQ